MTQKTVQDTMLEVVDFWLDRGVDGFRLDAVPFLFESEGTRCEGLPETHAFLKRLRERVDAHGRDVLLLGEAIQPVEEAAPYLADDELHGAFNFVLTAHLFAAIASGRTQQLGECLMQAEQRYLVLAGPCPCAITMNSGWGMAISSAMR